MISSPDCTADDCNKAEKEKGIEINEVGTLTIYKTVLHTRYGNIPPIPEAMSEAYSQAIDSHLVLILFVSAKDKN